MAETTTASLHLTKLTPAIQALFSDYGPQLGDEYSGHFYVTLASSDEEGDVQWVNVLKRLQGWIAKLGLPVPDQEQLPDDETLGKVITVLAQHFGVQDDPMIINLVGNPPDLDDDTELADLFDLALRFDDGHGATVLDVEGGWWNNRGTEGSLGGHAMYITKELAVNFSTVTNRHLAAELHRAMADGDVDMAAECMLKRIRSWTAGIADPDKRQQVELQALQQMSDHLRQKLAADAAPSTAVRPQP